MASTTPIRVLIFSKTSGFRHDSIPAGIAALQKIASAASNATITCDVSEDATVVNTANLSRYRVLVFLQTSGEFLDEEQLDALRGYIRGGRGGFVGIHCASSGLKSDAWYGGLVGAVFTEHPDPQDGVVKIEDTTTHVLTRGFPAEWRWHDEWYNFMANPSREKVRVLLSIDEACYEGGKMGRDHPLAWCQVYEGTRSFYTALGHFAEAWEDDLFVEHVTRGLYWTAGLI